MPDLLKDIREQLDARLAELRPLVDEHGRLNTAMKALGETKPRAARATPASSPVKTTSARAHKPPPAKRRKRAPRGANRQAVLRAASERPGGTRAELAAVSARIHRSSRRIPAVDHGPAPIGGFRRVHPAGAPPIDPGPRPQQGFIHDYRWIRAQGVDPNTLSALLARLVKAGELQTRALPTGRTGYALADSAPAQPAGA